MLLLAVLTLIALLGEPNRQPIACPRAPEAGIVLDADLREWAGSGRLDVDAPGQPAEVRALWSDGQLHLAVTVTTPDARANDGIVVSAGGMPTHVRLGETPPPPGEPVRWATRVVGTLDNGADQDVGFVVEITLPVEATAGTPIPASVSVIAGDVQGPGTHLEIQPGAGPPVFPPITFGAPANLFTPSSGGAFFPRLAQLSSGALLCAMDTNEGVATTQVRLMRSLNGGATWQRFSIVATGPEPLANGSLLELPGGALLCAYRETIPGNHSIHVSRSLDEGATWDRISTVHTDPIGLWEPWLEQLADGTILCAYASEGYQPQWPQVIEVRFSRDGGATWGEPAIAARHASSRDGVPALVNLPGHALMCFFEAQDLPPVFSVRTTRSLDGGRTWIDRSLVHTPASASKRAAAPAASIGGSDRILVGYYSDEAAAEDGDAFSDAMWTQSVDLGQSWAAPQVFHQTPATDQWPHLLELHDGSVVGACFTNEGGTGRLLSRRATP